MSVRLSDGAFPSRAFENIKKGQPLLSFFRGNFAYFIFARYSSMACAATLPSPTAFAIW